MDVHETGMRLARELDADPIERRDPRLRCKGTAEIRVLPEGRKGTGTVVDLSVHGCCIEADGAMPAMAGDCVEVCFRVEGFALRLAGIVRHMQGEERAGIEFTDVCRRKEEQIKDLVNELFNRKKALGLRGSPEKDPGWIKRRPSPGG